MTIVRKFCRYRWDSQGDTCYRVNTTPHIKLTRKVFFLYILFCKNLFIASLLSVSNSCNKSRKIPCFVTKRHLKNLSCCNKVFFFLFQEKNGVKQKKTILLGGHHPCLKFEKCLFKKPKN